MSNIVIDSGIHKQNNACLTFFFQVKRGMNLPKFYQYLHNCANENLLSTFVLVFHLRDCRGGKGERYLGRKAFVWLFINYPQYFKQVMHLIPEYGRWDDLLYLFPSVLILDNADTVRKNFLANIPTDSHLQKLKILQKEVVQLMANQLKTDQFNMILGYPVSVCAKWAPTEGSSLDKQSNVFRTLAKTMNESPQNLRRLYNTPLRLYLKNIETYICSHRWTEIDLDKVPFSAMRKLKKSLGRHIGDKLDTWYKQMSRMKRAKSSVLKMQPHEILARIRKNEFTDTVSETQWQLLIEEAHCSSFLKNSLVVCDVSPSMYKMSYLPLDVAISTAMISAEICKGDFHNHIISFQTKPRFVSIAEQTINAKLIKIKNMGWASSLDIDEVFNIILDYANKKKVKKKDMPEKLFIVSDQTNVGKTIKNREKINNSYAQAGYERAQIIFWNVDPEENFSVTINTDTIVINGFTPEVFQAIIKGKNFDPVSIMNDSLENNRYDSIRTSLHI
jgi:hypothetical protein